MTVLKALILAVIPLPAYLLRRRRGFDESSRREGTCLLITDPAPTPDALWPHAPARPSWDRTLSTRRRGLSTLIHVAVFGTPRAPVPYEAGGRRPPTCALARASILSAVIEVIPRSLFFGKELALELKLKIAHVEHKSFLKKNSH